MDPLFLACLNNNATCSCKRSLLTFATFFHIKHLQLNDIIITIITESSARTRDLWRGWYTECFG